MDHIAGQRRLGIMDSAMPETVGWTDILVRLGLTLLAGTLIGLNRSEHGRPAGLRTVLLVCLAASIAMIQMNLLLPTRGRARIRSASWI
jgi:putative Mg2+ transporter-C (MgtC) family protein